MLYVVATPIGNLGDITLRALQILKDVDLIAAEDTRHSGILLKHYEIRKPLISYHEHNEAMRTAQLVERLAAGENIALITDAGTPGLSDPGARLIHACIERELPFTIIPGASSISTALVGSGFSVEKFFFGGFLPVKSGRRERELVGMDARAPASLPGSPGRAADLRREPRPQRLHRRWCRPRHHDGRGLRHDPEGPHGRAS